MIAQCEIIGCRDYWDKIIGSLADMSEFQCSITAMKEYLRLDVPDRFISPVDDKFAYMRSIILGWRGLKSKLGGSLIRCGPNRLTLLDWIRDCKLREIWIECLAGNHFLV